MDEYSEPQPDVALLKPRDDFYASGHPKSEDVFLIIEVADSTVKYDRTVKIPLYAEDAIVEVWLVNLNDDCVEVYRQPSESGYQSVQTLRRGQSISASRNSEGTNALAFPDVAISIDEILG